MVNFEDVTKRAEILKRYGRTSVFLTEKPIRFLLSKIKHNKNPSEIIFKTSKPRYKVLYKVISPQIFIKLAMRFLEILGYIEVEKIEIKGNIVKLKIRLLLYEDFKFIRNFYGTFLRKMIEDLFGKKLNVIKREINDSEYYIVFEVI